MVLPKNPASQKQNPARSSTGNSNQFNRAFSTRAETVYAAKKRITIAMTGTGHHPGLTKKRTRAGGSGIVNNWPRYPMGRDRRVLRTQRSR